MTLPLIYMKTAPAFFAAIVLLFAGDSRAMSVNAVVKDDAGMPVGDAVVYATPLDSDAPAPRNPREAVMDQRNKEFVPYVLPIQTGTTVIFPNKDDIRHHVYSISPAKRFGLPLYKGTPAEHVVFDKPGAVMIGCNIHDWMLAYIYVMDTPYFTKTGEDGKVELRNLPQGAYEVRVWHPRMKDSAESTANRIAATTHGKSNIDIEIMFQVALKPEWRPPRAPSLKGDTYR
jgi:plastocyanin